MPITNTKFIQLPATAPNFAGLVWQNPVINRIRVTSVGLTPVAGDRYIIAGTGGAWSLFTINDIVEFSGAVWTNITPTEGYATEDKSTDELVFFNGTNWTLLPGIIHVIGTSTDKALVRWNGAGGDTIQNSLVTLSDLGEIANAISLTLNNGATDGGAVYFNGVSTSFLKSTADGLTLDVGGFTLIEPSVTNTIDLGTTGLRYKDAYFQGNIIITGNVDGVDVSGIPGTVSAKVAKAGDTMTGDLTMDNQKGIIFRELTAGGTNSVKIEAPDALAGDYTLKLPLTDGSVGYAMITDGFGNLGWSAIPVLPSVLWDKALTVLSPHTAGDDVALGTGDLSATEIRSKTSPVYNVKENGLIGNGIVDDATALQALVTLVGTAGGGVIYFPTSTYKIGSTINFNLYPNMTIRGDGMYLSVLDGATITTGLAILGIGNNSVVMDIGLVNVPTSLNACVLQCYGSNIIVDRIHISAIDAFLGSILYLSMCTNVAVRNSIIESDTNISDAIYISTSSPFIIENVTVNGGRYGIFSDRSSAGKISNCTVWGSDTPIYVGQGAQLVIDAISWSSGGSYTGPYNGITLDNCVDITISHIPASSCSNYGLYIKNNTSVVSILDSMFVGAVKNIKADVGCFGCKLINYAGGYSDYSDIDGLAAFDAIIGTRDSYTIYPSLINSIQYLKDVNLATYSYKRIKITKTFTDFSVAAFTNTIPVFALPIGASVKDVYADVTVAMNAPYMDISASVDGTAGGIITLGTVGGLNVGDYIFVANNPVGIEGVKNGYITAITNIGIAAIGSLTALAGVTLTDGDTFTLDDGVNPAITFEFDSDSSVFGANIPVPFTAGDDAATVHTAMITAINDPLITLAITASDGGGALVNLANDAIGTMGNILIAENLAVGTLTPIGMGSGTDIIEVHVETLPSGGSDVDLSAYLVTSYAHLYYALSTNVMEIGNAGTTNKYLLSSSVYTVASFLASGDKGAALTTVGQTNIESFIAPANIVCKMTAVGGLLNQLSQGSIDFYIEFADKQV